MAHRGNPDNRSNIRGSNMVIDEKTKIRVGAIGLASILLILIFFSKNQIVEIIYFTNPRCIVVNNTNDILREIKEEFKDRISIREIKVSMYENDLPDTPEIKWLRDKYHVFGVPDIIINGKKYTGKFNKEDIMDEICRNFIIEPEVCI